jgi:hypothetical protein
MNGLVRPSPRFRRLIEYGLILTRDIGLDVERRVDDLVDPDPQAHHFGLSKTLLVFCDWMRQWAAYDCAAARAEVIRRQASGERYLDLTADDLPKRHPVALLDILWAVLPTYIRDWPYSTEPLIRMLSEQPTAASDRRLVELMRRLRQR